MPSNSSDLYQLVRPSDYLSATHHVFPSQASLAWFIRRNRQQLTKAGALVRVNRRVLLDAQRFDAAVLEISRAVLAPTT